MPALRPVFFGTLVAAGSFFAGTAATPARSAMTPTANSAASLPPLCYSGNHTTLAPACNTVVGTAYTNFTTQTTDITITNTSASWESYDLTCTYTAPITACPTYIGVDVPNNASTVHALGFTTSADTGTATLTITATSSLTGDVAKVQIKVPVRWPTMTVATDFNNNDNQNMSLCAGGCFAAMQAVSSVPYFSLGEPRNITLAYHGDRVAVRPFVYADVTPPGSPNAPDTLILQVKNPQGAFVTFTNGETRLRFTNPGSTVRLGGQFDASTYATGLYGFQLIVSAVYVISSNHTETQTFDHRLLVANERTSRIARGWTVAGVPRMTVQTGDTLIITEGEGSAIVFKKTCTPGCSYITPAGDFTSVTESGTGTAKVYTRTFPDGGTTSFNYLGQATSIADRFGNAVTFEYDGSGRLIKVFDPFRVISGTSNKVYTRLHYGTYGIDSIIGPGPTGSETGGRVTRTTVASDSTLRAVIDPDGDSTRFVYDASRRLSQVINRRGDAAAIVYNAATWKVDSLKSPQVPIDAGGGSTTLQTIATVYRPWQMVGVPATATATTAATPIIPDSMTARVTDGGGHMSTYTVDRWGQPLRSKDPIGRVTTIARSGIFAVWITHHDGSVDSLTYEAWKLVASKPAGQQWTYYRYGVHGQVDSIWGGGFASQRIFLATNGRVDSVRVAGRDSLKTRYRYPVYAWRADTIIDPKGHVTAYRYDAVFGQPDNVTIDGNRFTATLFDGFGRDTATRANGQPWRRVHYDAINRITEGLDGVNANPTVFTYDGVSLIRVQDPKGQVYRFAANALGWLEKEYDPADTLNRFISYRYDKDGQITSRTNRKSQILNRTYDALHRMTSKSGTSATTDSLIYSDVTGGQWVVGANAVSRDSIFVNTSGVTTSVITRLAVGGTTRRFATAYGFDSYKRLISTTVTSETGGPSFAARAYVYSAATGMLDTLKLNGVAHALLTNKDQQRFKVTGLGTANLTDSITTHHRVYERQIVSLWHGYGYDTLGRVTDYRKDLYTPAAGYRFVFDNLGRLQATEYSSTSQQVCTPNINYGYRCTVTVDSTRSHTYDAVGNDTLAGSATYTTGNRLATWSGSSYEHDLSGARTRKCVPTPGCGTTDITYVWTNDGLLEKVISGTDTTKYDYNAFGVLVRKRKNAATERHFLWEGGQLFAELDSNATKRVTEYGYYPGVDQPMAIITGATTVDQVRYLALDVLGNVVGYVSGVHVIPVSYDPWGKIQTTNGTIGDTLKLRWKGLLWEGGTTGLYYMRARWYDPETHRFVSEDPIGLEGGINMYVFVGNDPVNGHDPLGLSDVESPRVPADCGDKGYKDHDHPGDKYGFSVIGHNCAEEKAAFERRLELLKFVGLEGHVYVGKGAEIALGIYYSNRGNGFYFRVGAGFGYDGAGGVEGGVSDSRKAFEGTTNTLCAGPAAGPYGVSGCSGENEFGRTKSGAASMGLKGLPGYLTSHASRSYTFLSPPMPQDGITGYDVGKIGFRPR